MAAVLPAGAVIGVDQEGGRVARLRPPAWRAHPPAAAIGALNETDPTAGRRAAWLTGALIGLDCAGAGITLACAPVLDRRIPGTSDVIGDRAFGADPAAIATLGAAMAEGLLAAGVLPVAKHAPGHGRAEVDSHFALPSVPADYALDDDVAPFAACAGLPWMMTAHLLYRGLDSERPGTLSPAVICRSSGAKSGFRGCWCRTIWRCARLAGTPGALAQAAVAAGCDLALHCTGVLAETEAVLRQVPEAGAATLARMQRAADRAAAARIGLDGPALAAERDGLLG